MKNDLIQAYRQSPWRIQLQWIGMFLLLLVLVAAIAGVYLNLSARSAASGRQVQMLENKIEDLNMEINDLSTKLAKISSSQAMLSRLVESEYILINPNQAFYLEVSGFEPDTEFVLAPPASENTVSSPVLKPEYSNSLWDRLLELIDKTVLDFSEDSEVRP